MSRSLHGYTEEQWMAYLHRPQVVVPARVAAAHSLPASLPAARTPQPLDRYRSKTERLYAQRLAVYQYDGLIKRWWYEPAKGLYLAPQTSYTPDFLIEYADPTRPLEMHEVKGGFVRPQDWQKTKQAAAIYTCFRFLLAQYKGGEWQYKEVPAL
jgi:hypothetical protein